MNKYARPICATQRSGMHPRLSTDAPLTNPHTGGANWLGTILGASWKLISISPVSINTFTHSLTMFKNWRTWDFSKAQKCMLCRDSLANCNRKYRTTLQSGCTPSKVRTCLSMAKFALRETIISTLIVLRSIKGTGLISHSNHKHQGSLNPVADNINLYSTLPAIRGGFFVGI